MSATKGLNALVANFWHSMPNLSQLEAFGKCLANSGRAWRCDPGRTDQTSDLANLNRISEENFVPALDLG